MQIGNGHIGRAAELLVCFDFVIRGYNAVVASFPGSLYDVLVDCGRGTPLRVQVKATTAMRDARDKTSKLRKELRFNLGHKAGVERYTKAGVDVFAFVAINDKSILYVFAEELTLKGKTKSYGIKSFKERAQGSLDQILMKVILR